MFGFHFHRYRNFKFIRTIHITDGRSTVGSNRIYEGRCEVCGMAKIRKRKE